MRRLWRGFRGTYPLFVMRVRVRGAGMLPFARDFLCELACSPKYRRPCHRMEVTTRSRNSSSPFPQTPASGIYVPTTSHQTTFITLGYVFLGLSRERPTRENDGSDLRKRKKENETAPGRKRFVQAAKRTIRAYTHKHETRGLAEERPKQANDPHKGNE